MPNPSSNRSGNRQRGFDRRKCPRCGTEFLTVEDRELCKVCQRKHDMLTKNTPPTDFHEWRN